MHVRQPRACFTRRLPCMEATLQDDDVDLVGDRYNKVAVSGKYSYFDANCDYDSYDYDNGKIKYAACGR